SEEWISLLMAPTVQIHLNSGGTISATLLAIDEGTLTLRNGGQSRSIALSTIDRIEPTGEISREVNGTRGKFRGDNDNPGETWNVPMDAFELPSNAPPYGVAVNIAVAFPDAVQLETIRENHSNYGYIVETLQPLPDGHMAVTVKVVEVVEWVEE
ncbi:MAG: hypothetical protein AB4042_21160, partial [Leptolyngbyaceae cyanobacterium]